MQKFIPEIQAGAVILRIYKDGKPTSAYCRLDLNGPRPGFVPAEVWAEALTLQSKEDEKPF
jgi:hypothetical protein